VTFPGGERVAFVGSIVQVDFGAGYCGDVQGLCGNFEPDQNYNNTYSAADGSIISMVGNPQRWGGPFYGDYQYKFADSFLITNTTENLFTEQECPVGHAQVPIEPPTPWEKCPELQALAEQQCPSGPRYNDCLFDVSFSCDLSTWVEDAQIDDPIGTAPTPPPQTPTASPTHTPTASPTAPLPTAAPTPRPGSCIWTNCQEMADCDGMMRCSSSGDPHMKMFSGSGGHPQGSGPYVFAQTMDKNFVVQTCHQPTTSGSHVSLNTRLAVKTSEGVFKYFAGTWTEPANSSAVCGSHVCHFPDGEIVAMFGSRVDVALPASACGGVQGLCGNYNPARNFFDAYSDEQGRVVDTTQGTGQPWRWGGPFYGRYQNDFADSFKVGSAASLFSAGECGTTIGSPTPSPDWIPPMAFAQCPHLKANAIAQCPMGPSYTDCIMDVGMTCDLSRWIAENQATAPPDVYVKPTPAPTTPPAPGPPAPTPAPCPFGTCAQMAACPDAKMSCRSGGDPHVDMFAPGKNAHPQGHGPYVFAQNGDKSFVVQVCHRGSAVSSSVSSNHGVAVKYGGTTITRMNGEQWPDALPTGVARAGDVLTFPGGEQVAMRGGIVQVSLNATYCGQVEGLCGNFSPDQNYYNAFTAANGRIISMVGNPVRWGGPFYGDYQYKFADSYKVSGADNLFTHYQCPVHHAQNPIEPPTPWKNCPELQAIAEQKCPLGPRYNDCLFDVSFSCNIGRWIPEYGIDDPIAPAPTPPPTPLSAAQHTCDLTGLTCETTADGRTLIHYSHASHTNWHCHNKDLLPDCTSTCTCHPRGDNYKSFVHNTRDSNPGHPAKLVHHDVSHIP
jgi:hypothetical protein